MEKTYVDLVLNNPINIDDMDGIRDFILDKVEMIAESDEITLKEALTRINLINTNNGRCLPVWELFNNWDLLDDDIKQLKRQLQS